MSDLLNGFNAGMKMGAPFVEAQLRKRAFRRQAAENLKDRESREGEAAADRILAGEKVKAMTNEGRLDRESAEGRSAAQILATAKNQTDSSKAADDRQKRSLLQSQLQAEAKAKADAVTPLDEMTAGLRRLLDRKAAATALYNDPRLRAEDQGRWEEAGRELQAVNTSISTLAAASDYEVRENGAKGLGNIHSLFQAKPARTGSQASEWEFYTDNFTGEFTGRTSNVTGKAERYDPDTGSFVSGDAEPVTGFNGPGPSAGFGPKAFGQAMGAVSRGSALAAGTPVITPGQLSTGGVGAVPAVIPVPAGGQPKGDVFNLRGITTDEVSRLVPKAASTPQFGGNLPQYR